MFTKMYYKQLLLTNGKDNINTGESWLDTDGDTRTFYTYASAIPANAPYICMQKIATSYRNGSVVFGTGDISPTENDYCLSGDLIETLTGTATVTQTVDENGFTLEGIYTLTNTGNDAVTIKEIGMIGAAMYYSGSAKSCLFERTVLDTPVTIPAGGIGQVTYAIRFNYPTA